MDVLGDDSEYQFHYGDANHRVPVHTTNRKPHDGVSSPSIWHWLMWALDFFASPSFGVVVALVAIALIHYKAIIFNFLSDLAENGIQETLLDCCLNLCDLARAYYQIICEVIRNFFAASGYSSATPSTGYLNAVTTDSRSLSMSTPPPLAIIPCARSSLEQKLPVQHAVESTGNGSGAFMMKRQPLSAESCQSTGHNDSSLDEIEPAFLDDRDYPKGWLVYHPTLGVISKEEADKHDRKGSSV